MKQPNSSLNQINYLIVAGLLVISVILWIGIFVLFAITGKSDSAIIVAASSIPSGLIGFLTREFKAVSGDDNSTAITGPIDTKNDKENEEKTN